jgi:hypothetical protein
MLLKYECINGSETRDEKEQMQQQADAHDPDDLGIPEQ